MSDTKLTPQNVNKLIAEIASQQNGKPTIKSKRLYNSIYNHL